MFDQLLNGNFDVPHAGSPQIGGNLDGSQNEWRRSHQVVLKAS